MSVIRVSAGPDLLGRDRHVGQDALVAMKAENSLHGVGNCGYQGNVPCRDSHEDARV
jgi:hypothetical protein